MTAAGGVLRSVRIVHEVGAWFFDRSGPLAPALARLGNPLHNRLFPHSFFVNTANPFLLQGLRIHHEGRPSYHMQMLAMGMHDRDVFRMLSQAIRPGMTILYVGAHIGYFSLLSASLIGPRGRVWAFEPNPDIFQILLKNIRENRFEDRLFAVPEAVSSAPGRAMLHVNSAESMVSSLCTEAAGDRSAVSGREVSCTTLDAWAAKQGWPAVDLIKIDVEGLEASVLAGMVELSRRNPHLKLIVSSISGRYPRPA